MQTLGWVLAAFAVLLLVPTLVLLGLNASHLGAGRMFAVTAVTAVTVLAGAAVVYTGRAPDQQPLAP
jgi:hypothetical protein